MNERMHDLTMRVDAAAPRTGTRLTAACRYNSRFTRGAVGEDTPVGAMRYDVQVYQGVPYLKNEMAQVELVFGVGNLIRSATDRRLALRRAPRRPPSDPRGRRRHRPVLGAARAPPGLRRPPVRRREGNTSHPNA